MIRSNIMRTSSSTVRSRTQDDATSLLRRNVEYGEGNDEDIKTIVARGLYFGCVTNHMYGSVRNHRWEGA